MTRGDFSARGGWWVLAQAPILLFAAVLPPLSGDGALVPASALAYLGAVLTLAGMMISIWGAISLGSALTPFPAPHAHGALRRDGAFRLARHPIYTGVMFACLGWALWWASAWGVVYIIAVVIFFDRKAAFEERLLRQRFPDYPEYASRVRKFVPGIY